MTKRSRIIIAVIIFLLGVTILLIPVIGSSDLKAGGISETGYDLSSILLWSGFGLLGLSALFFVLAGTE